MYTQVASQIFLEAPPLARISHTHGKEGRSPFGQIFDIAKSRYPQDIGDERGRKDDLSHECEKCGLSTKPWLLSGIKKPQKIPHHLLFLWTTLLPRGDQLVIVEDWIKP